MLQLYRDEGVLIWHPTPLRISLILHFRFLLYANEQVHNIKANRSCSRQKIDVPISAYHGKNEHKADLVVHFIRSF